MHVLSQTLTSPEGLSQAHARDPSPDDEHTPGSCRGGGQPCAQSFDGMVDSS